jgi:Fe-S cluster assembly ATPase SufC
VIHYSRFKSNIRKWYISLRLDTDPRLRARDVEAAFSGCDSLEVEVWQAMFASADMRVLKLFEGVRDVSKVKVHGSVGRRYSDWLERCMMSPSGSVIECFAQETIWDAWTHGNR